MRKWAGPFALTALVAMIFSRATFLGEVFCERDLAFDWVTQVEAAIRAIASGGERKRNEGGVPVNSRGRGAGVGEAYFGSRRAGPAPLPRGCGAPRFPPCARLRNRDGVSRGRHGLAAASTPA